YTDGCIGLKSTPMTYSLLDGHLIYRRRDRLLRLQDIDRLVSNEQVSTSTTPIIYRRHFLPYSIAQTPMPVPTSRTLFAPSVALGDRPSSPRSDNNHRLWKRSSV